MRGRQRDDRRARDAVARHDRIPEIAVGRGFLADTAIVLGRVNPQPGATLGFALYGPDDPACGKPPVFELPNLAYAPAAVGVTTVPAYAPTVAGTYRWRASYSGDANNVPLTGVCGDPAETVVVAPGPRSFPLLRGTITLLAGQRRGSRALRLVALSVRPVVGGSTVRLRCTGGRRSCAGFTTLTRKIARNANVRSFTRLLPKRRLRPGAAFEVRVTKPETIGRVLVLRVFARKQATRTYLCLQPGAAKPATCP